MSSRHLISSLLTSTTLTLTLATTATLFMLSGYSSYAQASTPRPESHTTDKLQQRHHAAWQAWYDRDYTGLNEQLKRFPKNDIQGNMLRVGIAVVTEQDDHEDALTALTKQYPDNADVRFFAGKLWFLIKENASFFNKMSYIDKHIENMVAASKLAPTNPEYLTAGAKALAWEDMWDSDKAASAKLVTKLKSLDPQWHIIANMDLMQNTKDQQGGERLIATALKHHNQHLQIMYRTANLMWTYDDDANAQKAFSDTCALTPTQDKDKPAWRDACLVSGYIALNDQGDKSRAAQSLDRFLSIDTIKDDFYLEALTVAAELQEALSNRAGAITYYEAMLTVTNDKSLIRKVKKTLKKLRKS